MTFLYKNIKLSINDNLDSIFEVLKSNTKYKP